MLRLTATHDLLAVVGRYKYNQQVGARPTLFQLLDPSLTAPVPRFDGGAGGEVCGVKYTHELGPSMLCIGPK